MQQGDSIAFRWSTDGGEMYYDFHAHMTRLSVPSSLLATTKARAPNAPERSLPPTTVNMVGSGSILKPIQLRSRWKLQGSTMRLSKSTSVATSRQRSLRRVLLRSRPYRPTRCLPIRRRQHRVPAGPTVLCRSVHANHHQ